jgi:AsmA protein
MVQGSWSDPIMLPDPQSRIQRSGAAAPLLDALRNHGVPDQVRSAIERLTGSAPPRAAAPREETPALAGTSVPTEASPAGVGAPPNTVLTPELPQPQ